MATKIRLARHGRKGRPFYHIVVADSRAPRDGKFIERIGSYNPNTNPATINLDFDKALTWLNSGAQPTDTAKAILSYEGVMMMKHLQGGVKKGSFDQAAAELKFEAWKKEGLSTAAIDSAKARLEAETKVSTDRAEAIAKKAADAAAEIAAAEAAKNAPAEAANEEGTESTEA